MEFHFYSYKLGERQAIQLQLRSTGWLVQYGPYGAISQPDGFFVTWILRNHQVNVPPALNDAMEELWEAAHRHGLEKPAIQERLDGFSQWLQGFNDTIPEDIPINILFGT